MADAFRGLTIRLGADARPLNSAISSIKNSAAAAQKQMNLLNKALKFDSSNATLMQSKLDLMGDKALHSARAFDKIRTAMKQTTAEGGELLTKIGKTSGEFKKLVGSTTDAYAATQKIRDELFTVDSSLQHIYDDAARVVAKMGKISQEDAAEYIKLLRQEMRGTGEAAQAAEAEMRGYIDQAAGLKGVAGKFGKITLEGKELLAIYDQLRDHHKRLESEQETMNAVEGFRAMRLNAQAYRAELTGAVAETAKLQTELYALGTGGRLSKAVSSVKQLEGATEAAVAHAHQMVDAYKAMPKNMNAAVAKIKAVAMAEETVRAKTAEINAALDKIKSDRAFDKQAASSAKAYVEAVRVEQKYTQLGVALQLAKAKADQFNKELNNMNDNKVDKASEDFLKCEANVKKAEAGVEELQRRLAAMGKDHAAAALTTQFHELQGQLAESAVQMKALHAQVSKLRALSNLGKGLREFGFGMYASLTPAITMAGRYAVEAAKEVDSAYRDMRKTVNGTEEQFEHLKEEAIEFSRTHVTSADTILEIEAMGGQLGIAAGDLEAFAHTVSNLDIATNMEADDISEQLGKMASVMGINVEEYDNFGDSLVRLGNNMPVMEGDIMNLTMRYMGMGKVVGLTADQMLGWSAAASSTGQKAEAAGSSMQRFISNMESAVNGSAEDLQKWANIAGMSADEFKQSFETDASGTMYRFIEGLGEMQRNGESVNQVLKDLGINNVRDKQLLEGLAQQMANGTSESNLLKDSLQMSSDAYHGLSTQMKDGSIEKAGDAMREAEKKSEGFSGEFGKLCNNAKALAVELGDASVPILKELGGIFQDLTGFVHNLSPEIKEFAVKFGILLAAIGPLSVGFGTFFQIFEKMKNGIVGAQGLFVGLAGKLNAMNIATKSGMVANLGLQKALMGLSSTPALLAITAITGAVQAFGAAIDEQVKKRDTFKKATEGMTEVTRRATLVGSAEQQALDDTSKSANSAATSVDELVESTAALVDAQNERIASSEKDIGQLRTAQRIINTYANTDMSGNVAAQGQFRAAVELVNEKCGTQYKVIDAVNGVLADENGKLEGCVGAINDYIKKKLEAIKVDTLSEKLAEDSSQLDTAIATWSEASKALHEYEEAHKAANANWNPNTDASREYYDLKENARAAKAEVDKLDESVRMDSEALGNAAASADDATRSIETLARGNSTLNGILSQSEMDDFVNGIKGAGVTMQEFNGLSQVQLGEAVDAWRSSGYDIGVALDSLGIKVKSMAEQYQAEMKTATDSTKAWDAAVKLTGMNGDELAAALDGAGISAAQFASIGAKSFSALYTSANGDFSKIQLDLQLLNAAGIDPKTLHVDDSGVLMAGDQVVQLGNKMSAVGDRQFKLNVDTGAFEEVKAAVSEVSDETEAVEDVEVGAEYSQVEEANATIDETQANAEEGVTVNVTSDGNSSLEELQSLIEDLREVGSIGVGASISVDFSAVDSAKSSWNSLKSAVGSGAKGNLSVNDSSVTSATTNVGKLADAVRTLPSKKVSVTVSGGALSTISSIKTALDNIDGKEATTYVTTIKRTKVEGQTATGGIVPGFAKGALIPRHAAGAINGIATRAMMTNIGWVGEDGAEAIFHMRNAGGAVVPLSNRRYVRPFARAVAGEMGAVGSSSVVNNVSVSLTYDSTTEARQMAREVADELHAILAMGA